MNTATTAVTITTKTRKQATNESDRPAYADLSFVRGKPTRYGWDHADLFAVPDEESSDGWMTGLRAFQELQQLVKAQPKERDCMLASYIKWTMEEAVKARETAVLGGKSKAGAANAFTECAAQFLLSMLRSNDGQWMADRIARQQVSTDRIKEYLAKQKADKRAVFLARMQAARAAKREAREAVATASRPA